MLNWLAQRKTDFNSKINWGKNSSLSRRIVIVDLNLRANQSFFFFGSVLPLVLSGQSINLEKWRKPSRNVKLERISSLEGQSRSANWWVFFWSPMFIKKFLEKVSWKTSSDKGAPSPSGKRSLSQDQWALQIGRGGSTLSSRLNPLELTLNPKNKT